MIVRLIKLMVGVGMILALEALGHGIDPISWIAGGLFILFVDAVDLWWVERKRPNG